MTQAHARAVPAKESQQAAPWSNMTLLMIATGFFVLTVLLVLIQPMLTAESAKPAATAPPVQRVAQTQSDAEPRPSAHAEASSVRPRMRPALVAEEPVVTQAARAPLSTALQAPTQTIDLSKMNANALARPQFALFSNTFTPLDQVTSAVIKQQMRQPIRLTATAVEQRTIPSLTEDAISRLTLANERLDPKLIQLISAAVIERQSDEYIRSLVNSVAPREGIRIPATLRKTDGTWDTYSLIKGMAQMTGGPLSLTTVQQGTNGTQRIVTGDSLARIALRYYGQPFKFDIILAANPQIDPLNPLLEPGALIQMPKP